MGDDAKASNMQFWKYNFVKNYYEKYEAGYILEVDVKYPGKINEFHRNFFAQEKKI